LRQTLAARFPDIPIADLRPSPLAGMFEVFTGTSIAYVDASGDHLLVGQLIDTRTRQDLSAESLEARTTVDFNALPLDRAIRIVKGDGSRKLAVFSDPDCPFCEQLEKALAPVTNVTIHVLLLPIESLHPDARARSLRLWCAKDPAAAWSEWMLQRKDPADLKCDNDPVEQIRKLAVQLKIESTPTVIFANGRKVSGTLPAWRIEQYLNAPSAAVSATGTVSR
jgi:thiol:disulfide interchange protein DsbC